MKAPDRDVAAEIKKRLIRLCETYQRDLTPEMLRGYIDALGDLSEIEVAIGFVTAMRRAGKFMPNPGEIRDALVASKDKQPMQKQPVIECSECGGTGYKLIPHPKTDDLPLGRDYKIAVRCTHNREAAQP